VVELSDYAYKKLKDSYLEFKKEMGPTNLPAILAISKKKSNDRSSILRGSAIDCNYIDDDTKEELLESGYVQKIENTTLLSLTASGVWAVESEEDGSTIDDLINGIDDIFYNDFKTASITPSNKIVVFAMISMRSFSEKSSVDVKIEKNVSNYWWNIFLEVNDFLIKMGIIKSKDSLRKEKPKSGIEDKASNLIRHSDKLPRFTYEVFSKSRKNQYWLDLIDIDRIDIDKLSFLIKQILKDSITIENYEEFANFANDLCLNHRYEIESSYDDVTYLSCEYDSSIIDAFTKAVNIQIN